MAGPGPGGRAGGGRGAGAGAVPELQAVPAAPVEDGAGEKPVRRRRKARGDKAAEPSEARKARKRREGWNGSVYRRPSKEALSRPAEADDGPFIEDPLDDIGRR